MKLPQTIVTLCIGTAISAALPLESIAQDHNDFPQFDLEAEYRHYAEDSQLYKRDPEPGQEILGFVDIEKHTKRELAGASGPGLLRPRPRTRRYPFAPQSLPELLPVPELTFDGPEIEEIEEIPELKPVAELNNGRQHRLAKLTEESVDIAKDKDFRVKFLDWVDAVPKIFWRADQEKKE